MNTTTTPTTKKISYPLRLPPEIYRKIREVVNEEYNKGNYGYSINQLLTELIENGLKEKK